MPGCLAGAFVADLPSMGPKKTLFIGVTLQGIIGFIMAGCYPWLSKPENVAGFVVVYGIFLALGEFGPGDNIGLVASKTCATGIRYEINFFCLSKCSRLTLFQGPILRHRSSSRQNRCLCRFLRTRRDTESGWR